MITAVQVREQLAAVVEREGAAPADWDQRLEAYLKLLAEANDRFNLVSRKTVAQTLQRHVLPSLAALQVVGPGRRLRVLDVGTGGGFPGIPLVILRPEIRLDLVDATRKKCEFLKSVVQALEVPDARVHWCRIEEPPSTLAERVPFDRIFARAMGGTENLRRSVAGWVAPGGGVWEFAPPTEGGLLVWRNARAEPVTELRPVT